MACSKLAGAGAFLAAAGLASAVPPVGPAGPPQPVPVKPKPIIKTKAPHARPGASLSAILNGIPMVRKAQSMYGPAVGKMTFSQQLVNQPYFTPAIRAEKLLFFGHYAAAARNFRRLLGQHPQPAEATAYTAGLLSALLHEGRRGHVQAFDAVAARLAPAQRLLPRIARLLAVRARRNGHLRQALAVVRASMQAHPLEKSADFSTLRLYNLYARILEQQGYFAQAVPVYRQIAKHATGRMSHTMPHYAGAVTQVARATDRYGVLTRKGTQYHQLALNDFTRAADHDRTYWPANLAMAQLLLKNHNLQQGEQQLQNVLQLNPRCVRARSMLFELYLSHFAMAHAAEQLAILQTISDDPRIDALQGRMLLQEGLAGDAIAPLLKAVHKNPAMRLAHGWLAGAYFLQNQAAAARKQFSPISGGAAASSPETLCYAGDIVGNRGQYKLAEKLYSSAAHIAPWDAAAWEGLGRMYLYDAHENKAAGAEAFAAHIDPYDESTANEITVLTYLKTFSKIRTRHFIVLYNPKYDTVMAHLAARQLERVIYPGVCGDFHYTPKRITRVEFFPTQSEFSVRIAGTPWIPCIGATTGYIIAMDDPKNGTNHPGRFDWAQVLRHEFTHTVTLAMTHNRVPRWLTEGAAVYEQQAPRDWRNCELLASNYRAGELFTIPNLSLGFIRPKRSIDSQLAYMEGEWIFQYIMQHYGRAKMLRFLYQFRQGKTQAQAFQGAFGISTKVFYGQFLHWAGGQIAKWGIPNRVLPPMHTLVQQLNKGTPLQRARAHYDLGVRYLSDGHLPQAMALFKRAVGIDATYLPPREAIGMVELSEHQDAAARAQFKAVMKINSKRPVTVRSLGQLALHAKRWKQAEHHFLELEKIRPRETSAYRALAGIYLMQKHNRRALVQLNALQAHDQSDDRIPRMMALLYQREHHLHRAAEMAYKAIRVDPYNAVNEDLMGQVRMSQNTPASAVRFFRYATELQPQVSIFWRHLAAAYAGAGQAAKAAAASAKAAKLHGAAAAGAP